MGEDELSFGINESDSGAGDLSKEDQLEIEKNDLLSRVVSGNIRTLKDRVAFVLNNSVDARNSDPEMAWQYWRFFDRDKFDGGVMTKQQFRTVTSYKSLVRERAKIQNSYKLFLADVEVQQFRGVLEQDTREQAIEDSPDDLGLYSVYVDETGKTQGFLSVGSLWLLKSGYETYRAAQDLTEWKKINSINHEFHFTELSRNRLDSYKQFFEKFLTLHPEAGFKIITLTNRGLRDVDDAITHLTFHLLHKGIEHENDSGRAPLPRVLQVWIDEDEKSRDKLKLENIRERLKAQNITGLHLADFEAVSSKENDFIQIVDLFTGAVNRKLHPPEVDNYKDEFADHILRLVSFDPNQIERDNTNIDNSTLFSLR